MILCSGWVLLSSSSGACGTDQITHGSFSWEAWQGLCVHDGFVRTPSTSRWLRQSLCLSVSPSLFSPSSILIWTSLHGSWNTRGCNVISTVFYWSKPVNQLAQIWGEGKRTWSACLSRTEKKGRGHVFRPSTTSINNVGNQVCLCAPKLPLSTTWVVTKSTDCSQHTYLLHLPRSAPKQIEQSQGNRWDSFVIPAIKECSNCPNCDCDMIILIL